jgi:Zn-dependent peptidase ImmA (M78 family)
MVQASVEAQRILRKTRVSAPPVPVQRIARSLGATIEYEPFSGDISGMLFRDSEQKIIGVNATHAVARQRFTIAHELGHLVLHEGRPVIVDKTIRFRLNLRDGKSSLASDAQEIQANQFAAELLMPASLIEHHVNIVLKKAKKAKGTNFSDDDLIAEMAIMFNTSKQAMEYRLANMRIISTHVFG